MAGGSPPAGKSTVDRIDYTSDTSAAAPKGNLSVGKRKHVSTGNKSFGYFVGGTNPSSAVISTIAKFPRVAGEFLIELNPRPDRLH